VQATTAWPYSEYSSLFCTPFIDCKNKGERQVAVALTCNIAGAPQH